jgi:hypothetical protein
MLMLFLRFSMCPKVNLKLYMYTRNPHMQKCIEFREISWNSVKFYIKNAAEF